MAIRTLVSKVVTKSLPSASTGEVFDWPGNECQAKVSCATLHVPRTVSKGFTDRWVSSYPCWGHEATARARNAIPAPSAAAGIATVARTVTSTETRNTQAVVVRLGLTQPLSGKRDGSTMLVTRSTAVARLDRAPGWSVFYRGVI